MTIKHKNPIPTTPKKWKKEIKKAYLDAKEAIPFVRMTGHMATKKDLFHLAPIVSLKFRGITQPDGILKEVTEFTLANYVANMEINKKPLSDPFIAFAFCYLLSHWKLDLIDEQEVERLMDYLEQKK